VNFGILENLARLLAIGTVIFFAMAGYALVSWILGVTEFKHLKESVRGKLLRKFKRHL
jgi:hypothetical protein